MALLQQATNSQHFTSSSNNVETLVKPFPSNEGTHKMSEISVSLIAFHHKKSVSNVPWIFDTGATDHMICSTSYSTFIQATVSYSLALPNGENVFVRHVGTVKIS